MKKKILVLLLAGVLVGLAGGLAPAGASLARATRPAVTRPADLNSLALFAELRDTLARFILNELAGGLSTIERIVEPAVPVVIPESAPINLDSVDDLRRS